MTISDAQDRLDEVLGYLDLPDDKNEWDMEEWTIFALDYLSNNATEILGLQNYPDSFKKDSKLWTMIFNAIKTTGDYKESLSYIEESLTQEEYYELDHFFDWLESNELTIGRVTYWERFMEFVNTMPEPPEQVDVKKWCEELWKELGDVPVDEEGIAIEIPFLHFEIGTEREEIWHWFEDTFDVAVHDLMYPKKENNDE